MKNNKLLLLFFVIVFATSAQRASKIDLAKKLLQSLHPNKTFDMNVKLFFLCIVMLISSQSSYSKTWNGFAPSTEWNTCHYMATAINDTCAGADVYTAVFGPIGALGSCPANQDTLDMRNYTGNGNLGICRPITDPTAWYTWKATHPALNFSTGEGNPSFELYGGVCGSLNFLHCISQTSGSIGGLEIDSVYFIAISVDNIPGDSLVTWCLEGFVPAINDECVNASVLPAITGNCALVTVNTFMALPGAYNGCFFGDDLWYSFVAPPSGGITFEFVPGPFNAFPFVGIWPSCDSILNPAILCTNLIDGLSFGGLTPDSTYYMSLGTFAGASRDSFQFCIKEFVPAVNDECVDATALPPLMAPCGLVTANTFMASSSGPNACNSGNDLWYTFIAPPSGVVLFEFVPGIISPQVVQSIWSSCDSVLNTPISCSFLANDQSVGGLTPDSIYYLNLGTFSGQPRDSFQFCLTEFLPAINDECENAIALPSINGSCALITANTFQASQSGPNGCFSGNDLWYTFVAPPSGIIVYEFEPGPLNASVAQSIWPSCGAVNGPSFSCTFLFDGLEVSGLTPDSTYYLNVFTAADFGVARDSFQFCLKEFVFIPAVNDECENAIALPPITGSCALVTANTFMASPSGPNGCFSGNDLWYTFIAPPSGSFVFEYVPGPLNRAPVESIWTSCDSVLVPAVSCAFLFDGLSVTGLTPDSTYYLNISTSPQGSARDSFQFCLIETTCFPPLFESTSVQSGDGFTVFWTNSDPTITNTTVRVCFADSAYDSASCVDYNTNSNVDSLALTGLPSCTEYDVYLSHDCVGPENSPVVGPNRYNTVSSELLSPLVCGDSASYPGCSGFFYKNNETFTFNICPDGNDTASITFTYFDLEVHTTAGGTTGQGCWDFVEIFDDGISMGTYCSEASGSGEAPSNPASDLSVFNTFVAADTGHCLTVVFDSDAAEQNTGFEFVVNNCTCPAVRIISGNPAAGSFFAGMTIKSDGTIESPNGVIYQAGNEILLNQPFEVELGAEFEAVIGDCP